MASNPISFLTDRTGTVSIRRLSTACPTPSNYNPSISAFNDVASCCLPFNSIRSAGVSLQLHHNHTAASLSCTTFRHGHPASCASRECRHRAIIYVASADKFAWLGLAWISLDLKISDLLNPKDEGKPRGVQQTRLTAALPEQYHSLDSQVG